MRGVLRGWHEIWMAKVRPMFLFSCSSYANPGEFHFRTSQVNDLLKHWHEIQDKVTPAH